MSPGWQALRYAAVLTSMATGAALGLIAGAAVGSRSGGFTGAVCFAGFGFSLGLLIGCVAATLFAVLLKPPPAGGPEADYDDGPPNPPAG
jgi:hypothetical protein